MAETRIYPHPSADQRLETPQSRPEYVFETGERRISPIIVNGAPETYNPQAAIEAHTAYAKEMADPSETPAVQEAQEVRESELVAEMIHLDFEIEELRTQALGTANRYDLAA